MFSRTRLLVIANMSGGKNKKASGAPHLNQEAIKSVVKSVLIPVDSDILNENLGEKVPASMASTEISRYDLVKIKTDRTDVWWYRI